MSLEDGDDPELPFYPGTSPGGDGGSSSSSSSDYPYYEQDLWSNSTSSEGGVEFGVAIINPNLGGNGTGSSTSLTTSTIPYGLNNPDNYTDLNDERNWVVVGILVALIVMLWVILGGMLCYPIIRFVKRKWPVSQRRINRRYETIEGWLITKVVRPHDDNCEQIQKNFVTTKGTTTNKDKEETTITITTSTSTITSTTTTTTKNKVLCSGGQADNHHDDVYDEENQLPGTEIIQHLESYDTMETAIMTIDSDDDDDNNNNNNNNNDDDQKSSSSSSHCFSSSGCGGGFGEEHHHHHHQECPICMERFEVGDIVSWSSYERCSHVYHHQCIKAWLLSHNTCPFCREVFLPVDNANVKKISNDVYLELSAVRTRRSEKTYFCVRNGLVTLKDRHRASRRPSTSVSSSSSSGFDNNSNSISNNRNKTIPSSSSSSSFVRSKSCGHNTTTLKQSIREKLRPGVTKADLKKLRGDRAEKICYGDTGGNITIIENHSSEEFDNESLIIQSQQQNNHNNNQTQQGDSTTNIVLESSSSELEPTISVRTADTSDDDDDDDDDNDDKHNEEQAEEEKGQEAGLDGLIENSEGLSSRKEAQEEICIPAELPLAENHSTTAIEVELTEPI